MKFYLTIINIYLNVLSHISSKYAGRVAFNLFQKVRKKKNSDKEALFYQKARHFRVPFLLEDLHCYEFGKPEGKLVFLVHGWDSNAGSLSRFAFELEKLNFRIISFDLPAHANTKETHTNLFICKNAFKVLVETVNPKEPFHVISHSFGSALSVYALSEMNVQIDKYILLTSNNAFEGIFLDFKNLIGFNEKIYQQFANMVIQVMQEELSDMYISKKLHLVHYNKLLIIHDKFDKVIAFQNAKEIYELTENSMLSTYEKIGHYRMLWNDEVVQETLTFIVK